MVYPSPGCFYYVIAGVGLSCGVRGYVIDKYAVNIVVNVYVIAVIGVTAVLDQSIASRG